MNTSTWLPVVWFGIVGFSVLMYVLLDGFVLGLGILAPTAKTEGEFDHMMNTAAPIWDGNETWLVLGGAGLFAAFPKAYAVILSALYLPVLIMMLALVFRGVAFEFRFKGYGFAKRAWGAAFCAGSVVATFCQGVILGAVVQGLPLVDGHYRGGALGWMTPFVLLTGLSLVVGYALLGASWLILKTEGPLHDRARRLARPLVVLMLLAMLLVSASLPFLASRLMARWFDGTNFLWLSPVPIVTLWVGWLLWRDAGRPRLPEHRPAHDARPFVWTMALFVLGFAGLVLGMWPLIVPPSLTIWAAAAAQSSQVFLLTGLVFLLPLVLTYTAWSYSVFRGKIAQDAGYHH